ncbi:MAG: hypothetical protein Q9167_008045 [Letrouitia subvulpina]
MLAERPPPCKSKSQKQDVELVVLGQASQTAILSTQLIPESWMPPKADSRKLEDIALADHFDIEMLVFPVPRSSKR